MLSEEPDQHALQVLRVLRVRCLPAMIARVGVKRECVSSVVVTGAGPVGLVAALVLASAGVRVTVLEAEPGLAAEGRASTFHPPTLEMLEPYGITAALLERGLRCPSWQIRLHPQGERVVFDLAAIAAETRYPFRLQCEQSHLARVAHERLVALPGAEVRFGCAFVDCVEHAGRLEVRTAAGDSIGCDYLIGADGAHSAVRRAIGLALEGDTYPETTLIVETDFRFEDHLEGLSHATYCWRDRGNFSMLRLPDRWRVGIYPLEGMSVEEQLADANVEARLQEVVPRAERYSILARRPYRTHNRIAPRYRVGRVFLAGDAAHLNSPTGGMGMNGGIHDAFNLADKLVAVLARGADPALLERYERERRPVAAAEILAQADRNRARMRERSPERRRDILAEMRAVAADPARLKSYLLATSMIEGLRRSMEIR